MQGWEARASGFCLGLGGMGLLLWLLMSLDRLAPFGFVFALCALPVLVYSISSFDFWPARRAQLGRRLAFLLYLGLALVAIVLGVAHGFSSNYVFPGALILLGTWPCVRAYLAERRRPYKQTRYRQPALQADGALIIKSSKVKLAWLVFLVGLLLAMSISTIPSVIGWVSSILLGALLVLAIYIYRPSANYLRIDQLGIEVVVGGQRSKSHWVDIVGFHVGESDGDTMVGILYSEAYLQTRSNARMQSGDGWIRDIYILRSEALCSVLNEWHAKATGGRPAKLL